MAAWMQICWWMGGWIGSASSVVVVVEVEVVVVVSTTWEEAPSKGLAFAQSSLGHLDLAKERIRYNTACLGNLLDTL